MSLSAKRPEEASNAINFLDKTALVLDFTMMPVFWLSR